MTEGVDPFMGPSFALSVPHCSYGYYHYYISLSSVTSFAGLSTLGFPSIPVSTHLSMACCTGLAGLTLQ